MKDEGWICCQIGAREHYAIPRALHAHGALRKLVTDFWFPPGSAFLRILPSSLKQDLRGRYHPDLAGADVNGLNFPALKFEAISRMRGQAGWAQIMARNQWFQRKVVSILSNFELPASSSQPILFAYSYAALEILRHAKTQGWRCVLGQIDPDPVEEKIVAEEVAREPELAAAWKPAPPVYWDRWHEECDIADRILVNSAWSKSALEKTGIPSAKISVVPLAYEPTAGATSFARSYPAQFDQNRPMRVLFLGQINLRKGVARLLKAIQLLQDKPIEFHFVGPVQISIPHDLLTNRKIHWHGAIPRSEVGAFYRSAEVFILPTLSDGFGLTQLEAQAWSLPIITSSFCGEVIRDGENGIVLDELSPSAISAALRSCMSEPARLRAFAANRLTADRFNLKAVAESLLGLFPGPLE
jgi:glycosyltransferase involved in cell wall biosynthesis